VTSVGIVPTEGILMSPRNFSLREIGHVSMNADDCALAIDEPYRAGLKNLDGFSHIIVVWWCHGLDAPETRSLTTIEQPYRNAPSEIGVFATRSPARPNPLALTPVRILGIDHEQGILAVDYVDAIDDSPIVDIKPYLGAIDRVKDVGSPDWCSTWPQWREDSATFDWASVFVNAQ